MKETAIIFILISACLLISLIIVSRVTIIKRLIRKKGKLRRELAASVAAVKDIPYNSAFGNEKLDVYLPKNAHRPLPLLLWVHGGGYVGGDKSSIEPWAYEIVSRADVAVACVNYSLAPLQRYPIPLYQINEAISRLSERSKEFPIDSDRLFIGGDSAGAQIAAQYASLSYDEKLRSRLKIPAASLKNPSGAILCCGFYDCLRAYSSRFPAIRTFLGAYAGQPFPRSPHTDEMNLFSRLSGGFCDAFVTCGTRDPFFEQSQKLVSALEAGDNAVESFFPRDGHEFQFCIGKKNSAAAADMVAEFIRKRIQIPHHAYDDDIADDAGSDVSETPPDLPI